MRILVTGSSGHLGEALMRTLRESEHEPVGLDILASPFTDHVGSIADRSVARRCMSPSLMATTAIHGFKHNLFTEDGIDTLVDRLGIVVRISHVR